MFTVIFAELLMQRYHDVTKEIAVCRTWETRAISTVLSVIQRWRAPELLDLIKDLSFALSSLEIHVARSSFI